MANPQKENGSLPIANELAEAFARLQISGNQWRIVWVILRQTYGWNKKTDKISMTQFQQKSGLKRRHTFRALKDLTDRKIVTKNDTTFITTYGINKDYSQWQMSPKKAYVQNGNKTVTKNDTKTVTKNDTHKIHNNKNTNPDFFSLKSRYPNPYLIDRVFEAIASTRKSGKVSDNILLAQLKKWARYPAEQVEAGINVYLEKNYAAGGRDEKYLFGIIRRTKIQTSEKNPDFNKPKYLTKGEIYAD